MSYIEEATARDRMVSVVRDTLHKYPHLVSNAINAIQEGVLSALRDMERERGEAKLAMALSLALLPPNRINDEARNMLARVVAKSIDAENATPSERDFLKQQAAQDGSERS